MSSNKSPLGALNKESYDKCMLTLKIPPPPCNFVNCVNFVNADKIDKKITTRNILYGPGL